MDLFGKKRIAQLEQENKKLQEEKDGALMLYNTTIKNHEHLEHEYRSLKAGSEGLKAIMEDKNRKVRELEKENRDLKVDISSRERALKTAKEDRAERNKEISGLEHDLYQSERTIKELNRQLEKYKSIMLSVDMEKINHFRYLRGKLSNASLKRSRNKLIRLLAEDMEKIFKEITE